MPSKATLVVAADSHGYRQVDRRTHSDQAAQAATAMIRAKIIAKIALAGYSQGAIVTAECWEYDIKPDNGRLHWAKDYVVKAVAWGNPMREAGKAYPDAGAAMAGPKSHGIADQLMVDTPSWWRNYAHKGDLYTDCEGDSGEMKISIYKVIMGTRVFSGPDSLLAQVLEVATSPLFETIAMFRAMLDAGMFFAGGTGPHVNYDIGPAINYLRSTATIPAAA